MRWRSAPPALVWLLLFSGSALPLLPGAALAAGGATSVVNQPESVALVPARLVELVNIERAKAHLTELEPRTQLMHAAQLQAEQMASAGQLDHVLNGRLYPSPKDRLAAVGYEWEAYGENIGSGHRGPSDVTESWMKSAGHRVNMLNRTYTELGTGYALDRDGRAYFVQVFGRPISAD